MKNYRNNFKSYLNDLSAKKPSPGAGSAAALSFCLGCALMEKAARFSPLAARLSEIGSLEKLSGRVLAFVDLDALLFEKALRNKGKRRDYFFKKSEQLTITLSDSCLKALSLARVLGKSIKKNIAADFNTGRIFVLLALSACAVNIQANELIFKRKNKRLKFLKNVLRRAEWAKF